MCMCSACVAILWVAFVANLRQTLLQLGCFKDDGLGREPALVGWGLGGLWGYTK